LLPQPFGRRRIEFAATYIGEALGNPSGGLKRGAIYEGRLNLAVDVDLEKLAGLRELTFHARSRVRRKRRWPGTNDPQLRNRYGVNINTRCGQGVTLQPNVQFISHRRRRLN
jgi:carbohydrate-selective porin OprB